MSEFNPGAGWTFYNPGGGGVEGGRYGNRDNLLNPFTGEAGTRDDPISMAWGPGEKHRYGEMQYLGGPFGWGRWEDYGPGVTRGDIAVGGRYSQMARKGFMPRLFQSGLNFAGRGREFMGGGGDKYWGRGTDLPGGEYGGGIPYYPEGSRMSETLGPLLEQAYGGGDSGDDIRNTISNEFSGPGSLSASNESGAPSWTSTITGFGMKGGAGTGVPTQKMAGYIGNVAGSFIPVPILGTLLGGAIGRTVARMIQGGATSSEVKQYVQQAQKKQGGQMGAYDPNFDYGGAGQPGSSKTPGGGSYDPFGGLPEGFKESNRFGEGAPTFTGPGGGYGPQWTGGSIFNANNLGIAPNAVAPRQFAAGQVGSSSVPAPGSIGGTYGQGSAGSMNMGGYDYWGNMSLKRLMQGGDPSLGMEGFQHGFPGGVLPMSQWGGMGAGRERQGSLGAINPDFNARSAR